MKRKLIALSYMYQGDYFKIKSMIDVEIDIDINPILNCLKKDNIKIITILDKEYPQQLKRLHKPPFVLYCLGDISLLNTNCAAVIGSRKCSLYGKNVCHVVIKKLYQDYTIVSGLAYGIDSLAHKCTLDFGGKTISVLGSGFNKIYPKVNINLAKDIKSKGLLISEYPPYVGPEKKHFPMRNRIISGLSNSLYVCEAAEKSGTKITADIALELGIDVYCAPGSIFSENYVGNHQLIEEGAQIIML